MEGHLASEWETSILKMLRSNNAEMGPAKADINKNRALSPASFMGTEMWIKSSFPANSIKELMRLTEEFEERKGNKK
jgi:hypothetical protein